MTNNTPIHAPLYPENGRYESDDFEAIAILMKVEENAVKALLEDTPFQAIGPYVWVELMVLRDARGIAPYSGGGIVVPASYRGTVGGYYAFCYVDTDDSLALGREAYGYPKKYATVSFQRTGRAITGSYRARSLDLDVSVIVDQEEGRILPDVPRYPHMLIQTIPNSDHSEPLFTRILARDTSTESTTVVSPGEGAVTIGAGPDGFDLDWIENPEIVGALHVSGAFGSGPARVLGVEQMSQEMSAMVSELSS